MTAVTARGAASIRFVSPQPVRIVPATDLGGVVTLKHGNLYLLSDQLGDVRLDDRGLGLYEGDTRILSCAALRINGERPALLQASAGGNYRGTVHLTNPELPGTPESGAALARGTMGIRRERILGDALLERLEIVNYSDGPVPLEIRLDLGCDHADMFEVRGYPRAGRGQRLPIAIDEDRITFRYVGLDGCERSTHIAFSKAPDVRDASASERDSTGADMSSRWRVSVPAEGRYALEWCAWSAERPAPKSRQAANGAGTGTNAGAGTSHGHQLPRRRRSSFPSRRGSAATRERRPTAPGSAAPRRSRATTRSSISRSSGVSRTCAC